MKIRLLTTLFLVFISCKNATEKKTEQLQIEIDSSELKIKTVEKKIEDNQPELEFDQISEIIKSTFEIENLKFTKANKIINESFYPLLDSTKIKEIKHYPSFILIEFNNKENAEIEFGKIKTIAEKSLTDKKELFDYYGIFSKSGISYNQVDKWIVGHLLRCNMYPKDYEIDKKFTSELEKLDSEIDWIRSYCGW
jgi:hypothetical protein